MSVTPVMLVTVGGTACGKSTTYPFFLSSQGYDEQEFVLIDPDKIMKSYGYDEAYRGVAKMITDLDYFRALGRKQSIAFVSSGRHFDWIHNNVIKKAKDLGYKVLLYICNCDLGTSMRNDAFRARTTPRPPVPIQKIIEIQENVQRAIPKYYTISGEIDGIFVKQ